MTTVFVIRESNIRATARLLRALEEIERLTLTEALPSAAYLELITGDDDIWQKLDAAGLAAREFLNNHNAIIEPKKARKEDNQ